MKRVALIGCGAISHNHLEVLKMMADVTVIALCDIRPERAQARAKEFQLDVRIYTDYQEMLNTLQPDVVHVTTPHYLHFEMAAFALKKGIHVVLEKPACINEKQLTELTAIAEKSTAKICVSFQNRFLERNRFAKEMIDSGEAGNVLGARGFVTWKRTAPYYTKSGWRGFMETEGGGVMINQAIHTLDLMLWLCGEPKTVTATIANRHLQGVIDVEDTAEGNITFANGATGLFYASTAYCTDAPVFLEVVCDKHTLTFFNDTLLIDGTPHVAQDAPKALSGKQYWGQGHLYLLQDFYSKLDTNEPIMLTVPEAGKAVRVLLAMYKSAGKPVTM